MTFDCPDFPELDGSEMPRLWAHWTLYQRAVWLRETGHAINSIEGRLVLIALGEWPADVSRESRPTRVGRPAAAAEPELSGVRSDRLSKYY